MRQLVLPGDRSGDSSWTLEGSDSKYIAKVLRLKPGDIFDAIDEAGHRFRCTVAGGPAKATNLSLAMVPPPRCAGSGPSGSAGAATASVAAAGAASGGGQESAGLRVALVQALPRGPRMDLIIRQATETGVADIFPLNSRYCVARERGAQDVAEKKQRRERIIRSALQQSGSHTLTKVHETTDPESLFVLLASSGYGPEKSAYLLCHEGLVQGPSVHEICAACGTSVVIFVGPEGGFSGDEIEYFVGKGCAPIHFEGPVLRAETAALYAIAAVKTILMERTSWKPSK